MITVYTFGQLGECKRVHQEGAMGRECVFSYIGLRNLRDFWVEMFSGELGAGSW